MYPQRPSDHFFFRAMLDDLACLWNRMNQAWRQADAGRTIPRSRAPEQPALRGRSLLLRCSQWLLRA